MSKARRDAFYAHIEKREAVKKADASGEIADSMDVRLAIMARVRSGEITLEQGQAELRAIKRRAGADGLKTRSQVYRES